MIHDPPGGDDSWFVDVTPDGELAFFCILHSETMEISWASPIPTSDRQGSDFYLER